jgi:hypothetical protein
MTLQVERLSKTTKMKSPAGTAELLSDHEKQIHRGVGRQRWIVKAPVKSIPTQDYLASPVSCLSTSSLNCLKNLSFSAQSGPKCLLK